MLPRTPEIRDTSRWRKRSSLAAGRPWAFALTVLIVAFTSAGGCVSITPAAPYRVTLNSPDPLDDEAWPARRAAEQAPSDEERASQCRVGDYHPPPVLVANRPPVCAGAAGVGCVHHYECSEDFINKTNWQGLREVFFFFSERVRTLTGQDGEGNEMQVGVRELAISEFALFEAAREKPLGLVVHLSSLTRYSSQERALIQNLRRAGWSVLVASRPYFERVGNRTFHLDPTQADIDGRRLADRNDQMIAEWAYAVEAVVNHLDRGTTPSTRPRAIIGCSAGALCLPAVVARMPQHFDAAVFVAGGADLLTIARRTTLDEHRLRRAGLEVHWASPPSEKQWRRLREAYLQSSRLDPYHTSAYLLDMPVLLLHARFDGIVPAISGDILYARLGKPERWAYPLTHVGLFLLLPTQTDRIRGWLEQAVGNN